MEQGSLGPRGHCLVGAAMVEVHGTPCQDDGTRRGPGCRRPWGTEETWPVGGTLHKAKPQLWPEGGQVRRQRVVQAGAHPMQNQAGSRQSKGQAAVGPGLGPLAGDTAAFQSLCPLGKGLDPIPQGIRGVWQRSWGRSITPGSQSQDSTRPGRTRYAGRLSFLFQSKEMLNTNTKFQRVTLWGGWGGGRAGAEWRGPLR